MKKCIIQTDPRTAAWYEEEISKVDPQILGLKLARPALRALVNSSIYTVKALRAKSVTELKAMHGMGPAAMKKMEKLLGASFWLLATSCWL